MQHKMTNEQLSLSHAHTRTQATPDRVTIDYAPQVRTQHNTIGKHTEWEWELETATAEEWRERWGEDPAEQAGGGLTVSPDRAGLGRLHLRCSWCGCCPVACRWETGVRSRSADERGAERRGRWEEEERVDGEWWGLQEGDTLTHTHKRGIWYLLSSSSHRSQDKGPAG